MNKMYRPITLAALGLSLLMVGGCANNSKKPESEVQPAAASSAPIADFLERADKAKEVEGGLEMARQIYREAAAAHPTDKRPWLRLAQSYFDGNDYGNAILAAQEVIQRDSADEMAQGILAVSGLRVSSSALSAIRQQNGLNEVTRGEAEVMARNLRNLLGEANLANTARESGGKAGASAPAAGSAAAAAKPRVVAKPRPAPVVRPKPAASAPAPAPSNPFGALR